MPNTTVVEEQLGTVVVFFVVLVETKIVSYGDIWNDTAVTYQKLNGSEVDAQQLKRVGRSNKDRCLFLARTNLWRLCIL